MDDNERKLFGQDDEARLRELSRPHKLAENPASSLRELRHAPAQGFETRKYHDDAHQSGSLTFIHSFRFIIDV